MEPKPALPLLPRGVNTAREKDRLSLALLLVALALGAAIETGGPRWAQTIFQTVELDNAIGITALLAALVASITLHEAGHLLAAISLDFEVVALCLGPVRVRRSHGKWSFEYSGKLFTGSVSAVPRSMHHWRERVLAVVAGGPITTLLTGLVAALILAHHPGTVWSQNFLAALSELSAFLFILGLVPNGRAAVVRNDARLFSIFWNNTPETDEILLYHLLTRLELAGVRPRDYPIGLIHAMAAMKGRPESMLVYAQTIVLWALDRGDIANATAWDEWALKLSEMCNETLREAAIARSACLDVLCRDDYKAAQEKLSKIDCEALAPAWLKHRTKALQWLLKENVAEALAEIARSQYAFPKQLPYYDFERTWLAGLHRSALRIQPKDLSIAAISCAA